MTGRHEGPPAGSAAREATASPYIGKRRAPTAGDLDPAAPWCRCGFANYSAGPCEICGYDDQAGTFDPDFEPDDPPRCWSCGHRFGDGCECSCCNDDHDGGPDDV